LGLSVRVENDARAATRADWRFGAGRMVDNLVGISLGTGIGGGVVLDGHFAAGARAAAGEIGHLAIVSGGRKCTCPSRGCWEAYAGGWAIAERAREAFSQSGSGRSAGAPRKESAAGVTARSVFRRAREGDRLAVRLVRETEGYMADGVVSVANLFNPQRIVLSGGLLAGWPRLAVVMQRAVRERCQPPAAGVQVVRSKFGEDAALVGAAAAAWDAE